ncbi:hypothetical protein O0L34_g19159 [Tuta absoluta]|nr:hypothetical protein O0L34_g19159 [Tuta absoluta]
MNCLGLRISNAGGKKSKSSNNFMKLEVAEYLTSALVATNDLFKTFYDASTADEQLAALKPILEDEVKTHEKNGECNEQAIQFLVKIWFNAEVKHPVKCFLARHITKNTFFQRQFSEILSQEIKTCITNKPSTYKDYVDVLTKISSCTENFPSGAIAVKILEVDVGCYLDECLRCCVDTLRNSQNLSPTEKNEIFNLAHLALRLILYIVQKVSPENVEDITRLFTAIRQSLHDLLFDADAPMDTKSVCGMLYLHMHVMENGPDSWVDILQISRTDATINTLLSNEASQLSLYSAIATVVPIDKLQAQIIDDEAALLVLCKQILALGERSSSESIFILGVTRALVQITKHIDKLTNSSVGLPAVANVLNFVWAHLEHYMDSVRHLTAQMLGNIVKYCAKLDKDGDSEALDALFDDLRTHLGYSRKSYYWSLTSLVSSLGACRVLARVPGVVGDVTRAASLPHMRASATTTLETLLQQHVKETDTKTIYEQWVEPILTHVNTSCLDSSVLSVLDSLLTKAVQLDPQIIHYIVPHIKQSTNDLKCVLILLSVARKAGVTSERGSGQGAEEWRGLISYEVLDKTAVDAVDERGSGQEAEEWRGLISYEVLDKTAVDAVDETRILSLSLIVESPKSTEVFTRGELKFVLKFVKYNINAQSPNFRQLMLSMIKKFIKRLEDSYKVLKKQKDFTEDYYVQFLEEFRSLCFGSLIQGANYSRRFVALQVLVWCDNLHLDGYDKIWVEDYVEKLLWHLEDSYENNKALALEILNKCPTPLITSKKYSISLELENILKQASALKPTECISAAYKLDLLRSKVPEKIVTDSSCNESVAERVSFTLLQKLQHTLLGELAHCEKSIASAAVNAPMYGVLHCMVHLLMRVDVDSISSDKDWCALIAEIIETCKLVNASVACVVNNSSPEGHLPMDMGGVTDHGNEGGLRLEDGRQVTAQMVLLCAWRSVKEVSLLLGCISSRLSISGEQATPGNLTPEQMVSIGEHFTKLLAETKHRGAFEQAYVGFTKLLARLWRCRNPTLHSLPRSWLAELISAIETGDKRDTLSVTRRGAGLPFMIQALVTTELQVQSNPKCFHECMSTLLRLARTPPPEEQQSETAIETRTHAINILRALFRNSALDESVAGYVGDGLKIALEGFEGASWMERNSSTLLFSALMVRVFGVARSKHTDELSTRNRMTGRIFFLRYPQLYDFMLDKLKEVSSSDNLQLLRPSLYPVLLLLARLYPSSLEGTVSNLKLSAYIPHVLSCAGSSVLKTRQLAAKAMVPLILPEHYLQHLEALLGWIGDRYIKRNYCHGILLQLIRLLGAKPDNLDENGYHAFYYGTDKASTDRIGDNIRRTYWVLEQAVGDMPCYLLADEYVKMINLVLWRFPNLIDKDMSDTLQRYLEKLIFIENVSQIRSGREVCLSNALYLYFILITKKHDIVKIYDLMYKALSHQYYEVVITTLNLFLILHENFECENRFEEHLDEILNKDGPSKGTEITEQLHEYTQLLCEVLKRNRYFECQQKTLKVLSLQKNTEKYIVQTKMKKRGVRLTDDIVINTLIECINTEHDNLTHIYLSSLSNYISGILEGNTKDSSVKPNLMLNALRVMFACCRAENSDDTRNVVVGFMENTLEELFMMALDGLSKEAKFEFKATVYSILVTLLEDDDDALRQRTADVVSKLRDIFPYNPSRTFRTVPNIATEVFRNSRSVLNVDEAVFGNCRTGASHPQSLPSPNAVEGSSRVVASRAAEVLREVITKNEEQKVGIFVVLALLDFKSEVCMSDDVNDECRVFDQNERYNIYLEETVWSNEAAERILQLAKDNYITASHLVQVVISTFRKPIQKLCSQNLTVFEKMLQGENFENANQINPKIELFVSKLKK